MNGLATSARTACFGALRGVLLAALLVTPLACTYLRESIGLGPQRPKVQLTDVDIGGVSPLSLDLVLTIRVDNPNDFDLKFSKLHYQVVVADLKIAAGDYDDQVTIPASNHASIKLPLAVNASNALHLAHDLLGKKDDVFAVMTATADFGTPLGAMQVNFEDKKPLKKMAGF